MNELQKAAELEREAAELRRKAQQQEQQKKYIAEQDFKKDSGIDVYWAEDYSGLRVGDLSFYFGYEETYCLKHKKQGGEDECECEDAEWAFVAREGSKELMRLPKSKVHPKSNEEVMYYLVAGIGHYLKSPLKEKEDKGI